MIRWVLTAIYHQHNLYLPNKFFLFIYIIYLFAQEGNFYPQEIIIYFILIIYIYIYIYTYFPVNSPSCIFVLAG